MLVIRRRAGESILIGDGISIEVVEISGSRVKLGIHAPPDLLILREELLATGAENLRASRSLPAAQLHTLENLLAGLLRRQTQDKI